MDSTELAKVVTTSGLAIEKAKALMDAFTPLVAEAGELCRQSVKITVTDATQVTEMKQARAMRLKLRDVRIRADKSRKELKEDALRTGKAIDGANNWLLSKIEPEEKRLEEAEKFAERAEAARQVELQAARAQQLRPFGVDPSFYQLGSMPVEQWNQLLQSCRISHENKLADEKKAAEARAAAEKARAKEEARLRAENERLQAERKIAEQKAAAERKAAEAKLAAERKAIEDKARIERQKLEARLSEERKAREAVEAAERERQKVEAERKAAEEEAAAAAAAAPDKDKLLSFVDALNKIEFPKVNSDAARAIVEHAQDTLNQLAEMIVSESKHLGKRKRSAVSVA